MGGQQGGDQGWSRAGSVGVESGWEHPSAGAITVFVQSWTLPAGPGWRLPSLPAQYHCPGSKGAASSRKPHTDWPVQAEGSPQKGRRGLLRPRYQAISVKLQTGPLALWPVWTACHLGLLIEPTHVRSPLGGGLSPRLLASPLRALSGPQSSPENPLLLPQPGPAPPHCPLHVTPQRGPYTSRLAPLL